MFISMVDRLRRKDGKEGTINATQRRAKRARSTNVSFVTRRKCRLDGIEMNAKSLEVYVLAVSRKYDW